MRWSFDLQSVGTAYGCSHVSLRAQFNARSVLHSVFATVGL